ncbi:hypothetical protein RI367_008012 [Sorochytrium milnesiophthora]
MSSSAALQAAAAQLASQDRAQQSGVQQEIRHRAPGQHDKEHDFHYVDASTPAASTTTTSAAFSTNFPHPLPHRAHPAVPAATAAEFSYFNHGPSSTMTAADIGTLPGGRVVERGTGLVDTSALAEDWSGVDVVPEEMDGLHHTIGGSKSDKVLPEEM